mgnify:FL=1
MIDQATIQKIFDAADIYEVVSDFVSLKKRGVNYLGLCPFHNEKTGSFTVSPAKGIYKCFGCGKGGNAVNFIMEHEQMSYVEALKYLAEKYHIPVEEKELTEEQRKEQTERESMLIVSAYANEYFQYQLWNTDEGRSVGLSYLRQRGISDEMIRKFGLGYNPEAWGAFTKAAQEKGYKKEFLVKTGLTIENDRGLFDRFRSRVMFPVQDLAGKIIAFGGRTMTADKKISKYLNSPESEIYHKSKTLYGIYFAKKSIVQQDRCILVEGYTDVISFHAKGIENVVASSGTSLTIEQIRLIRRLTPNVTIIYDGDAAGIKASLRGIDLVLEEGLNVRVLLLPDGEDPDSFARSHTTRDLADFITNNETDFINFKTKLLLGTAGDDPVERARLITDIVRSIAKIPDNIVRSVYVRETAHQLDVEERVLYTEIAKVRLKNEEQPARNTATTVPEISVSTPVRGATPCDLEESVLIRYMLLFGNNELYEEERNGFMRSVSVGEFIVRELAEDDLELLNPLFRAIQTEYQQQYESPSFIPARHFIAHPDIKISTVAANILSEPYELSKIWYKMENFIETEQMKLAELLPKILDNYKMRRVEMLSREIDNRILESQNNPDPRQIMDLLKRKNAINAIRRKLNEKLGRTGIH